MTRLLPLLLALAFAAPASAQVRLGVRAGVSIATLEGHHEHLRGRFGDFADRLGLMGGVTAELPLSDQLTLRTEVVYAMKGGRLQGDLAALDPAYELTFDADYAFDYVELPMLLEVVEPTPIVDLTLFAGPTFSLNVREHVDVQASGTIDGAPITDEQAARLLGVSSVRATDVGVTFGTRAVRDRLALEARFTLGLLDVGAAGEGAGTTLTGLKNRAFAVSVGYTL